MGGGLMPGFLDDTDVCVCGHIKDEHEGEVFVGCTVEDCDCSDFEWNGEEEDED
jgi:hypothetical protein